jgi:hypothetical protein
VNEQERAACFTIEVDRLLESDAPTTLRETPASKEDRELLALAQTLAQIDLSPQSAFLRRLRQPQGVKMQTNLSPSAFQPRRAALVFGLVLIVLALAFLAFPPARALAQDIWDSLFIRASSDSLPALEMQPGPVSTIMAVEPHLIPSTLAQVSAQAGFEVKEPTYLPEGFSLSGSHYEAERKTVLLFFTNRQLQTVTLDQQLTTIPDRRLIADGAVVVDVQIGENRGEYVRGEWTLPEGFTLDELQPSVTLPERTWNPDGHAQTLSWTAGEIAYSLSTAAGQETDLELADLLRIAESLR